MAGLGQSLNTYDGPVPPGVPNPYTVMLHSYPTRFHGPIYTRPQFGLPWAERPNDFGLEAGMQGLGDDTAGPSVGKTVLFIAALGLATYAYLHFSGYKGSY
jgi:hypothetical protein